MKEYGDWEFVERLGSGAFGEVWKVSRELPGLGVRQLGALKRTKHGTDEMVRDFFKSEVSVLASLSSAYIPSYLDSGVDSDGNYWMVSSFIEGKTLWKLVPDDGRLSKSEWLKLGSHITVALVSAHSKGIKHLDIKPDNIMRSYTGHFALVDFGLAKRQFEENPIVQNQSYSAPEQFDATQELTPAADIFSFGASLYFALTGQNPFDKYQGLPFREAVQSLGPAMSEIDTDYRVVLAPMLALLPSQRPSAQDLLKVFENFGEKNPKVVWHATRIKSWDQLDGLIYETLSEKKSFSLHLSQPDGRNVVCEIRSNLESVEIVISSEKEMNRTLSAEGRFQLSEIGFSLRSDGRYHLREPLLADDCPEALVGAISLGYELSLAELSYRIDL